MKLLYHFFHRLLHPFAMDGNGADYFKKSDWFLNYDNIKQRLYLSCKAKKMLEVLQNRLAIIYMQDSPDEEGRQNGELVCWSQIKTLPNFPFYALEVSSLPYFISDDFEKMCEFDSQKDQMRIVRTIPREGEKVEIGKLPTEALHIDTTSNFEKDKIKNAFACVAIRRSNEVWTYNTK